MRAFIVVLILFVLALFVFISCKKGESNPVESETLPTKGLIAYYPFNGNANDESGKGNNGNVQGAILTADRFGKPNSAYYFNGVNAYIFINSGFNFSNSSFTISVWAKRDVKGDYDCIIGQGLGTTNSSLHIGFRDVAMQYKFTFAFYQNDLDVPSQYSDLLLHNWICSYDVNTNVRKVYRDGVLVASDISTADYAGSGSIYIGLHYIGNPSNFGGSIDDIRIYNRALTDAEIQQLYHEGGL